MIVLYFDFVSFQFGIIIFLNFIEEELIYNVVLIAVQKRDSYTSSSSYCYLFILCTIACIR